MVISSLFLVCLGIYSSVLGLPSLGEELGNHKSEERKWKVSSSSPKEQNDDSAIRSAESSLKRLLAVPLVIDRSVATVSPQSPPPSTPGRPSPPSSPPHCAGVGSAEKELREPPGHGAGSSEVGGLPGSEEDRRCSAEPGPAGRLRVTGRSPATCRFAHLCSQRRWERRTTFFIVFTTSDPSLPVSAGLTARVPCPPFDKPVRGGAGTGTGGQVLPLEPDVTAANHV